MGRCLVGGVRVRRVLVTGVVAGLVVSLLGEVPAVAIPSAPQVEPPAETPVFAQDERSALAAAAQRGERVEVLPDRTESSQTFATPRGTLVVEEYVQPQWVRAEDGSWMDVDPTLEVTSDGSVEPRAATADMRFSGGGDQTPLAEMAVGGRSVGLWWPGRLPEPVVEGNTATYPNVAPQVDLQIVADVEGFTHLLVIRSPKALESPKVGEITLDTELAGVSLRENEAGAVEAVDKDSGQVLFTGPSPMMWDSRDAAAAGPAPKPEGPNAASAPGGEPGPSVDVQPRMAPVAVEVAAGELRLAPDMEMLRDPDTVYPVYVDPTWIKVTGKRNSWSLLRKSFPNSSFYNPPVGSTSGSDATKGIVRAGRAADSGRRGARLHGEAGIGQHAGGEHGRANAGRRRW